jgi:hypothetical protein
VFELADHWVFEAIGISGHTVKHLLAAAGAFCIVRYFKQQAGTVPSGTVPGSLV